MIQPIVTELLKYILLYWRAIIWGSFLGSLPDEGKKKKKLIFNHVRKIYATDI